ncbi:hypothetical protein VP01_4682g1 [Puccinia sorghi]|uniref:Uncharacterized protein n=1 Tax=Puccinia sorghi TaxID=27349 RepID=A0A0L6UQ33_9BASI|nr:hypothetical protein VP01_4682g1 [Puccinia sorghi]
MKIADPTAIERSYESFGFLLGINFTRVLLPLAATVAQEGCIPIEFQCTGSWSALGSNGKGCKESRTSTNRLQCCSPDLRIASPAAFIQQAKLPKIEDQPYKGVLKLKQNLKKNPVKTNHGSVDGLNEICTCNYAKVSSRVVRYMMMVDNVMLAPKLAWLARSQIQNVCAGGHKQISMHFPLDAQQLSAHIMSLEQLLHAVEPKLDLNNLPKPNLSLPSQSSNSQSFFPQFMVSKLSPTLLPPSCTARPSQIRANRWTKDWVSPHHQTTILARIQFNFLGAGTDFETPNLPPWNQGTRYPVDEYLCLWQKNLIPTFPSIGSHYGHQIPRCSLTWPASLSRLRNLQDFTFFTLGTWASSSLMTIAPLCHLQAFALLTITSFGSLQSTTMWIFAEEGQICAQECGPHQEVHCFWNVDPLQDYLRRQAFYQLYEHAQEVRNALLRTALLQEEDFDVGE